MFGYVSFVRTVRTWLLTGVVWHSVRAYQCDKGKEVEPETDIADPE